jgi:hypothetical protein
MTKPVCCLALALCVAACGPRKAVLVETAAPVPSGPRKPAAKPAPGPAPVELETGAVPPLNHGMRRPNLAEKLPDQRDMTATAPPAPGGGVIATPPTADKRDNE